MRRKLKITFKSGAVIKVNASDWTYTKDAFGNAKSLKWTTPRYSRNRLIMLKLDDVVSIVRTRW